MTKDKYNAKVMYASRANSPNKAVIFDNDLTSVVALIPKCLEEISKVLADNKWAYDLAIENGLTESDLERMFNITIGPNWGAVCPGVAEYYLRDQESWVRKYDDAVAQVKAWTRTFESMKAGVVKYGRTFPNGVTNNKAGSIDISCGNIYAECRCPRCKEAYVGFRPPKGHYRTMKCKTISGIKRTIKSGYQPIDGCLTRTILNAGIEYVDIPVKTARYVPDWVVSAIQAHRDNDMGLTLKEFLIKVKPA